MIPVLPCQSCPPMKSLKQLPMTTTGTTTLIPSTMSYMTVTLLTLGIRLPTDLL
jgi:hypothetical protein